MCGWHQGGAAEWGAVAFESIVGFLSSSMCWNLDQAKETGKTDLACASESLVTVVLRSQPATVLALGGMLMLGESPLV